MDTTASTRKQDLVKAITDKWEPQYETFGEFLQGCLDDQHGSSSGTTLDSVSDTDLVNRIQNYKGLVRST